MATTYHGIISSDSDKAKRTHCISFDIGTTTGAVYALSQRRLVKRDRKADHRYWKALRKSEKQDRKAERRYDHLLYRNP
ncbi:hypothetical protein HF568_15350 [Acidithiobacillus ferridurans]|uniref:Uncharacterized protein n=1 Tax=Acidithiobacillus ferridurans TaxID=1232575 RepID=A0A8X8GEW9_ACIFI|nr:hypothetical protein [Acidithiobacillus ferridurans]